MISSLIFSTLLSVASLMNGDTTGGEDKTEGIQWLTLEEASKMSAKENRPLLIDFYTDWCGWCKKLDATTYQDPAVIDYINQYFYAVKFNAESKESYEFNGKTYQNKSKGARSTNEFALEYAARNGRLGYPTTTFMFANGEKLMVLPGYQDASQMALLLKFLGEEHYKTMDYQQFVQNEKEAELAD
jgi:thioredoxin-related protein